MMVEVFKTNVHKQSLANKLVAEIHKAFNGHIANFDLEDCDRILRIQCNTGTVKSSMLIIFLKELGCNAEVLND